MEVHLGTAWWASFQAALCWLRQLWSLEMTFCMSPSPVSSYFLQQKIPLSVSIGLHFKINLGVRARLGLLMSLVYSSTLSSFLTLWTTMAYFNFIGGCLWKEDMCCCRLLCTILTIFSFAFSLSSVPTVYSLLWFLLVTIYLRPLFLTTSCSCHD